VVLPAEQERELRWLGRVFLPRLFDGEHFFLIVPAGEGKTIFWHSEQFRGILVPVFWGGMAEQTRRLRVHEGGAQKDKQPIRHSLFQWRRGSPQGAFPSSRTQNLNRFPGMPKIDR
jgi:hypothetical protein